MDDSDRNILASLRHEPCEGHCPDCGACFTEDDDLTRCDDCGWDEDAPEADHDWRRCDCSDCADERSLQRGKAADPERYETL
jgi:hypothetical protein